jgi:hypothetical protein
MLWPFVNPLRADTTVGDANNYIIQVDTDGNDTGVFRVTVGDPNVSTSTVIEANSQSMTISSSTLSVTGATALGSTLGVTGATTLSSTLDVNGLSTLSGGASVSGGLDNNSGGITEAGAISGVTTLTTSGDANVGGALNVAGATTLGSTLDVTGATTLGSTLSVTGATTLTGALTANGGETVNNGSTTWSGNGTGNRMIVDATSSRFVSANGFSNATVSNSAVSLLADSDASGANARSSLSMTPTTASLLVNTNSGESHGITINQTSTVISGGTDSTTLTLDDNGATFADEDTGAPVKVTGVANGVNDFDAVNMRQFRKLDNKVEDAFSGIASVAALAAIPPPVPGKNFSVGLGFGNFDTESAIAVGGKMLVGQQKDITLTGGVGFSESETVVNAGVGWSF